MAIAHTRNNVVAPTDKGKEMNDIVDWRELRDEIADELVMEEIGYERAQMRATFVVGRIKDKGWRVVKVEE